MPTPIRFTKNIKLLQVVIEGYYLLEYRIPNQVPMFSNQSGYNILNHIEATL